jgi:hypothetical protein
LSLCFIQTRFILSFSAGFYSFVYLVRLGKNAAGVGCRTELPRGNAVIAFRQIPDAVFVNRRVRFAVAVIICRDRLIGRKPEIYQANLVGR